MDSHSPQASQAPRPPHRAHRFHRFQVGPRGLVDPLARHLCAGPRVPLRKARSVFLGRFGTGLPACFVVAGRIRAVGRGARTPAAPPVEWTARDFGMPLPYGVRVNQPDPLVRRIGPPGEPEPIGTATEAPYGQAPPTARRPPRPAGSAPLDRAFIGLLAGAAHGEGDGR
ncbi:hypothetical protein [Streptomyces nogalater]|uniref:Uncharacterized protein n=1 Tax=Streptomyces nogalater TaxID=38314 RepID=A0ABW0WUQ0_STRNO